MPRERSPATQIRHQRHLLRLAMEVLVYVAAPVARPAHVTDDLLRGMAEDVRRALLHELQQRPAARRPKCVWCSSRTMSSRELVVRITNAENPHLCSRHSQRLVAETSKRKLLPPSLRNGKWVRT